MDSDRQKHRQLRLFAILATLGLLAGHIHVAIPYTGVLIQGRWAFGFIGFALLTHGWAALLLATFLSIPFWGDIALLTGWLGNLLYALPSLLLIRALHPRMLKRWGPDWRYGSGWGLLVLFCYQAFTTPAVWAIIAHIENTPLWPHILDGWRTQPFLIESILVALFSGLAMTAILAYQQLRLHQRRLTHINRVLLGIRNVNQLIVSEDDPQRLIERACINLTETMGYHNAWIALLDAESQTVTATAACGFDGGFTALQQRLAAGLYPDCMQPALARDQTVVTSAPQRTCVDCPLAVEYSGHAGLTRRLHHGGKTYGLLAVSTPGVYADDAEEHALFTEMAGDLAFALHKIETAEQLRASQQRYRYLIEHQGEGIAIMDTAENFTFANPAAHAIFGVPAGNLVGRNLLEFVRAEDADIIQAQTEQRKSGKQNSYEVAINLSNGEKRFLLVTSTPQFNDAGVFTGTLGIFRDITERKQAEAALWESEERNRVIIAALPDFLFQIDADLRFIDCRANSPEDLLFPPEQVIGRRLDELLPPALAELTAQKVRQTLDSGAMQVYEYMLPMRGAERSFEARMTLSGPRSVLSLVRDITARKQAEAALRQERDLSRALADAAAAVSRTLNPDEVLDRLLEQISQIVPNDTANIMLIENERQARVVRGRNYDRFGNANDIAAPAQAFDQAPNLRRMVESGAPLIIDDTATDPQWLHNTAHTWIRAYVGAPICARGTTIGFVNVNSATPHAFTPLHATILRAFADHAAIALENARIAHDLRQSEQRYRRLFERSNDAIFLVDRQTGRYQAANAAAEKLTGRQVTELQQLTTRDVTPEGAGERLTRAAAAQKALKLGEVQYMRPDGVVRTALLDMVPLDDHMAFGIARDITEQKEIEKHLRRQEQLAAIGQLAAGIAHDFRNLLTTIILYAQLGRRKTDLPPTVAQYLEIINGEAHKATDLVQQILDFSRRTEIERRPLDLVAFVSNVVGVLQRALPENIRITLNVVSGPCIVEGDAGRLQQALTNLALNARDAMPEGGMLRLSVTRITVTPGAAPPLHAMTEALAPPAWIRLSVADTGPGMTEEAYAHLFEPFFTTKAEDQGTGLGLAQVYGIIQLHDGYIDVENVVGEVEHGATFHIYLPASTRQTEEETVITTSTPSGQGETLLLVEDNARLREAEQSILMALGYRVLTAVNGYEALTLYQAESASGTLPHLLITDLVMPEMGGKALLQALRRHTPTLKALVMTGYTAAESEENLHASGFLEVIRKPFDADNLARAIRRALDTPDVGQ